MRNPFPPLAAGHYDVKCKESTAVEAAFNGHSTLWPETVAISDDGKWVNFYRDGRLVFTSNANCALRISCASRGKCPHLGGEQRSFRAGDLERESNETRAQQGLHPVEGGPRAEAHATERGAGGFRLSGS